METKIDKILKSLSELRILNNKLFIQFTKLIN